MWSTGVLQLLFLQGALSALSPSVHTCPEACMCTHGAQVNCSSAGLSTVRIHLPASVETLDLSHNFLTTLPHSGLGHVPLRSLTHLLLGHNRVTNLSLCIPQSLDASQPHLLSPAACDSWAPSLRWLSVEKNQLQAVPAGLEGSSFLEVLNLSYNKINTLHPHDLYKCSHLRELNIQHNLISTLHPLAFQHLHELQVLDLSFNNLGSTALAAYISLRNLKAHVDVHGNHWTCSCDMRTMRRWMIYDFHWSQLSWQVVCEEPSHVAGKDLMHVDDAELTCFTTTSSTKSASHQDIIVNSGADLLLLCNLQEKGNVVDPVLTFWWTPRGLEAGTDSRGSLLIRDVGSHDRGLYACTSWTSQQPPSIFDVCIRENGTHGQRMTRDVHLQTREMRSHSDFVLAICLSVFITFFCAFLLGALARPLLDDLWKRVTTQKRSQCATIPFENEGFSAEEESHDQAEPRSATGGQVESNVPYYITVFPNSNSSAVQLECSEEISITSGNGEVIVDGRLTSDTLSVLNEARPISRRSSPSLKEDTLMTVSDETCQEAQNESFTVNTSAGPLPTDHVHNVEFDSDSVDITEAEKSNRKDQYNYASAFRGELEAKWAEEMEESEGQNIEKENDVFNISWRQTLSQHEDNFHLPENSYPQVSSGQVTELCEVPTCALDHFTDYTGMGAPNSEDPNLDPDFWNDSGDSFQFSDSIQDESELYLSPETKQDPLTTFNDFTADDTEEMQDIDKEQYDNAQHKLSHDGTDSVVPSGQASLPSDSNRNSSKNFFDNGVQLTQQMLRSELGRPSTQHTMSSELTDQTTHHTMSSEYTDQPTQHTMSSEPTDQCEQLPMSFELADHHTQQTASSEYTDQITHHIMSFELTDQTKPHTMSSEYTDQPTQHTVTSEYVDKPILHTALEFTDESTKHPMTFDHADDPTHHMASLNEKPFYKDPVWESSQESEDPLLQSGQQTLPCATISSNQSSNYGDGQTEQILSIEIQAKCNQNKLSSELQNELTQYKVLYKLRDDPKLPKLSHEFGDELTQQKLQYYPSDETKQNTLGLNSRADPELKDSSFIQDNIDSKCSDCLPDTHIQSTNANELWLTYKKEVPEFPPEKYVDSLSNLSHNNRVSEQTPHDVMEKEDRMYRAEDNPSVANPTIGNSEQIPEGCRSEEPQSQEWSKAAPPSPTTTSSGEVGWRSWETSQIQTNRRSFLLTASPYTPHVGWNSVLPVKSRRSLGLEQKFIPKETAQEEAEGMESPLLVSQVTQAERQEKRISNYFPQNKGITRVFAPSVLPSIPQSSEKEMAENPTGNKISWRQESSSPDDLKDITIEHHTKIMPIGCSVRKVEGTMDPHRGQGAYCSDVAPYAESESNPHLRFIFPTSETQSSEHLEAARHEVSEA